MNNIVFQIHYRSYLTVIITTRMIILHKDHLRSNPERQFGISRHIILIKLSRNIGFIYDERRCQLL